MRERTHRIGIVLCALADPFLNLRLDVSAFLRDLLFDIDRIRKRQNARTSRRHQGRQTNVVRVPFDELLLRLRIVEHLVEEQDPLLYPVELFRYLLLVVWFLVWFLLIDNRP